MEWNGRPVTIVAGLHGNERAPMRALTDSARDFVLGNPKAFEENARFIERDLNASFGTKGDSYEERRARELLTLIPEESYVVDFHTTSAAGVPFAILTDPAMLPLAARTGCEYAILMTHNIKAGHALINHRDGVSVEISGYDTQEAYDNALKVTKHLESGASRAPTVLEVYDRITEPGEYVNFVEHEAGFIPVLVGEQSYDFTGLKARKI